jgi:hypothetical protein
MKRDTLLLALPLLLGLTGCESISGNLFKNDYWKSVHEARFYLGIRTTAREVPFQIGIVVSSVFAESPASRAGLRAGDEIRRIHFASVRTPGEARLELTRLFREEQKATELMRHSQDEPYVPTRRVRLQYFRDGRQIDTEVKLTTREAYLDLRRQRVLDRSHYEETGYNGIYFLKRRTLSREFIEDYFGVTPLGDIRIAGDIDILPLAFGVSLFRLEEVPISDATRVTVLSSLLSFSHRGTDVARTLEGLPDVPRPPDGSTDL